MFVLSLLESVAGEVVSKVTSLATDQLRLDIVWGFRKEINKLKESSTLIGDIIHDASHEPEDRELRARASWMKRLTSVAYNADDILDEIEYEVHRIVIKETSLDKKILGFFCNNPVVFRLKMARKIYNINTSLDDLYKQAAGVGLGMTRRSNGGAAASKDQRETTSFIEKNEFTFKDAIIVGRVEVVSNIIATLTNSNNQEKILSVMAIVGLGGLGKTTLARSITKQLKEGEMEKYFDSTLWVYVSNTFDVNSILHGMVQSCGVTGIDSSNQQALMESLQQKLKEKRYFLVLDDVWNENANNWDDLKRCLLQLNSAKGSFVIVTTRSAKVASIMETLPRCDLGTLSDDECWSILKDRAFADANAPIRSELEEIGRDIAKKCAGLPLPAKVGEERGPAIKELGGLNQLRGHLNIQNLEHVRDGEEAKKAFLVEKSHLSELTFYWSLRPTNNNETDVLDGLEPHGNLQSLKIHNFMGARFPSWITSLQNLNKIRLWRCGNFEGVPTLGHLPNLRSLEIVEMYKLKRVGAEVYGYSDTSTTLFPALKTLSISRCQQLIECIEAPRISAEGEIVVFPCLEELSIDNCRSLESIRITQGIASLRQLKICDCYSLSSLEVGLDYCTSLQELEIRVCPVLVSIPITQGMPSLRKLNLCKCNGLSSLGSGLSYCTSLQELEIKNCDNLTSIPITQGMPSLRKLTIEWCGVRSSLGSGLNYCTSLQELEIKDCYNLTSIPITQDMPSLQILRICFCAGLSSLGGGLNYCTSLQELEIGYCRNLTSIPITQGIPSLRSLRIDGCRRLLSLPSGLQFCTSLEDLKITDCSSLVSLSVSYVKCDHPDSTNQPEEEISQGVYAYLSLPEEDCRTVESIPPNLRHLLICHCGKLKYVPAGGFHHLTRLKTLRMGPFWEELDAFPDFRLPPNSQLEELKLVGWPKLKSLPQQIQHLTCLKQLWISFFKGPEALPEWLGNLTSLEYLRIWFCENLKYLPTQNAMKSLTKLNKLRSDGCPLLKERCTKETGPEWPKISHIPDLQFDS